MMSSLDPVTPISPPAGNAPLRKSEQTSAAKAIESYKTQTNSGEAATTRSVSDAESAPSSKGGNRIAKHPEAGSKVDKRVEDDVQNRSESVEYRKGKQDQVALNLTLSPEEKDAFEIAFSPEQGVATMSPEEKETLQKASERITKFLDETIARNADNRERVEKAVGEWYAMMVKGEPLGTTELISLLRQAAMGQLDNLGGMGKKI